MKTANAPAVRKAAIVAGVVFLAALLPRIANIKTAFVQGNPQFSPYDELYHAKRILYSAAHPFHVLGFDPDRGPRGAFCPWPPLYDLAAGLTARLLGGRSSVQVLSRVSWFPPVVSAFAAAFVGSWLTRKVGVSAGLLAGFGIAICPPFIDRSRLAAIDHHFLELPLTLGLVAAVARLRGTRSRGEILARGLSLGLALSVALFVQPALLLTAATALLVVLFFEPKETGARAAAGLGFLVSSAAVFLYRIAQPSGYPDNEWYLGIPYAGALLGAAVASAVQLRLLTRNVRRTPSGAIALAVGGLAAAAIPRVAPALLAGSQFFGGDPWLRSATEFRPLFLPQNALFWGDFCLLGGGAVLLLPMSFSLPWRSGSRAVLLAFSIVSLLASISSMRFLAASAPVLMISGAVFAADLKATGHRRLAVAAALLLLAPAALLSAGRVKRPKPELDREVLPLVRAAQQLRARTDAPGRVLSSWSWGHLFDVVGGRPVLIDNFGASLGRGDFENAAGLVLATREETVARNCRKNAVRFIVLENPLLSLPDQAEAAGFPRAAFEESGTGKAGEIRPRPLMRATFWWRTYFDPSGPLSGPRASPGGRFRLFYAQKDLPSTPPGMRLAVQVWELADGPEPEP
ncbi:MAG: STT3 domain-containing protein [Thermoanaerobaculia bacterium]